MFIKSEKSNFLYIPSFKLNHVRIILTWSDWFDKFKDNPDDKQKHDFVFFKKNQDDINYKISLYFILWFSFVKLFISLTSV